MKYFNVMERIDQMVRFESTGDSFEFSERLGISRRQLYYYIDELRDLGLPLSYNRRAKTFYYQKNCKLKIEITVKDLTVTELNDCIGGSFLNNFYLCNFCAHTELNFIKQ